MAAMTRTQANDAKNALLGFLREMSLRRSKPLGLSGSFRGTFLCTQVQESFVMAVVPALAKWTVIAKNQHADRREVFVQVSPRPGARALSTYRTLFVRLAFAYTVHVRACLLGRPGGSLCGVVASRVNPSGSTS